MTKSKPIAKPFSPLNIPKGKSGNCEITHEEFPAGHRFETANFRCRMFGGQKNQEVSWPHPVTVTSLLIDGARMMSDLPIEQAQHDVALTGMRGHVLVGGLGLGYAAAVLAAKRGVKHITVVEINPDVITLVSQYVRNPRQGNCQIELVCADLLKWLENCKGPTVDHAFYDIWASDGEGTFHDTVVPLHKLSVAKIRNNPVCWNEDVMRGQLADCLSNKLFWINLTPEQEAHIGGNPFKHPNREPLWENDDTDRPWHNWSVPFWKWWKEMQPDEELFQEGVKVYAGSYGLPTHNVIWQMFRDGKLA